MRPFLLPAALLLGLPATAPASSAADAAVAATNPILDILASVTNKSESLYEQTNAGMNINPHIQYGESVVYYVNFIHSLNRTRRNFPQLANPLSADEQQATCSYFEYQ
ncbi:hypothetical protein E4U53_008030, partial [Claviceps sorghi]